MSGTRTRRETRVKLRIYFDGNHSLGPGKIALLEAVQEHGSISAAARALGMAYRHAWVLVDDVNQCFDQPVVTTSTGGSAGGGARLTPFGEELVHRFRAMERGARRAVDRELGALRSGSRSGERRRSR